MRIAILLFALSILGCFESHPVSGDGGVTPDAPSDVTFDIPRFDVSDVPLVDVPLDIPFTDVPPDVPTDVPFEDIPDVPEIDAPMCSPDLCPPPSAPTCVDGDTLRVFGDAFCDDTDACDYPVEDFGCEAGCDAGRCAEPCGRWVTDIVADSGRPGGTTSLALGQTEVFISYAEANANELRLARYERGIWQVEAIGRPVIRATTGVIDVDTDNTVVSVFSPPASLGLRLSTRSEAGLWNNELIPGTRRRISAAIAIDSLGATHVLHGSDGNEVGYTVRSPGGEWGRADISAPELNLSFLGPNSLVTERRGGVSITHALMSGVSIGSPLRSLWYARRVGAGSWQVEFVTNEVSGGPLTVDSRGTARLIAIQDEELVVFVREARENWRLEQYPIGTTGTVSDAIVDESDTLHVSFLDEGNDGLGYASLDDDGTFSSTLASNIAGSGANSSLQVGLRGIHISHQTPPGGDRRLFYSRFLECIE